MMRHVKFYAVSAAFFCFALSGIAQTPAPIVTQPASATANVAAASKPIEIDLSDSMKSLEEIKAANIELLKQQQATLELLDQLQKDADQIRIFSKRG